MRCRPAPLLGAGIKRHERVRKAADEVTLPHEMDARTLRPAHAALRGSAAARRRVAGLALGAATSTTSVLSIARGGRVRTHANRSLRAISLFELIGDHVDASLGAGLVFVAARRAGSADGADRVLAGLDRQC